MPPAPGLHAHLTTVARPWVEARHASPVVRGIFEGTLHPAVMAHWIEQDNLYLRAYTRTLSKLASQAPDAHLSTLVDGAHYTINTETDRLAQLAPLFGADLSVDAMGPACRSYVGYLEEHSSEFGAGVVAVLPCMIGFAAIGLAVETPPDPRYRKWVEIYSSADFQGYAARFAAIVDELSITRSRAEAIFGRGMEMEHGLWDEAGRVGHSRNLAVNESMDIDSEPR